MIEGVLIRLVAAELALVAAVIAAMVGHAVWLAVRRRRLASRLVGVAADLAAAVQGKGVAQAGLTRLDRLPTSEQIAAFDGIGANLAGVQRERLTQVAVRVGLIAKAERWCTSRRWGQRLRGARLLTLLEGGTAVVPSLLDDVRPEVRAQAALWAGAHPDPESIERLLAMLSDRDSLIRFTVQDSLMRVGRPAIEPLLRHLSAAQGAPTKDALELAAGIADVRFLMPALELCRAPEGPTRSGAATLAGSIGGSQATTVLMELLGDRDPGVRSAAAKALGTLGHWPAGGKLAACLSDSAWDVRQAAGIALRALGPAGVLLLRKALSDPDRFARDVARQVLDLPGDDTHGVQAPAVSQAEPSPQGSGERPPPPESLPILVRPEAYEIAERELELVP